MDETQIRAKAEAEIQEMRRASQFDHAWAHCLVNVRLNGKKLADTEANRNMLENMLQPHETPSAAIYETIVKQYPHKFSFEMPRKVQSAAEREAEFAKICRENFLSECDANRELHKKGASLDAWAGASALERAKYQEEAAQARQHHLIHTASPNELRAEAAYEWKTNHDSAVREDAERRHQQVLNQQSHYPPLPLSMNGEAWDGKFFRTISTTNYPLFKQIVRKYGCGNVTERLRQN